MGEQSMARITTNLKETTMLDKPQESSLAKAQDIEPVNPEQNLFRARIERLNGLACSLSRDGEYDREEAIRESQEGMKALGTKGGLQEMLAAQILSVHHLQQITIAMSNKTLGTNSSQYYTNTSIKLANIFVQQANLLNKLQGNGEQKIIVEHVDVHSGGQAIVGAINGGAVKK